MTSQANIQAFLAAAVPLWIKQIETTGLTDASIADAKARLLPRLLEQGDVFLFRGKNTAEVANAVAETIAILAHAPGGVTAFGLHFEVS